MVLRASRPCGREKDGEGTHSVVARVTSAGALRSARMDSSRWEQRSCAMAGILFWSHALSFFTDGAPQPLQSTIVTVETIASEVLPNIPRPDVYFTTMFVR